MCVCVCVCTLSCCSFKRGGENGFEKKKKKLTFFVLFWFGKKTEFRLYYSRINVTFIVNNESCSASVTRIFN